MPTVSCHLYNHACKPTPPNERVEPLGFRRRLALALLPLVLGAGPALSGAGVDFYISPQGSDANPGTRPKPFATLEAARDAVRALKRDRGLPNGGVTIWLRGGDYLRTHALELTVADSGSPEAPIAWRAWGTEAPRLLGGVRLASGHRESQPGSAAAKSVETPNPGFVPVTDPAVRGRLDEAARDQVRQFDLRALGLTQFGGLQSRGFSRATTPAHCELFFAGRPMTLARWPNAGEWAQIAGFPEGSGQGDDHGGRLGELAAGFTYAGDRPRRWQETTNVWVHGYWAWDWANSYERVASIDLDRRLIRTAAPHGLYGFRQGQRFHFLNALEELDQPGEWFLEPGTGLLYFWPPGPLESGEALLSLSDQPLFRLVDAAHVTVRGLLLEATRGTAIEIRGGANNRIAGCLIRNIGNYGVTIDGGRDHRVVGCDIVDTGDGGVSLSGGDRRTLRPAGHGVENCHFERQGRWSKCYVPAVLMNGVGMHATHNLIHDHPHCAILFNGNDHRIEYNDIHHIALETGDVGAIYTGRDYTYRGNRIRYNFIHETGGVGMGSMGVYMDDCVSGTEVFGNIFYKVHWAMFIGGGRDNRVENNLFVECDPAVRADGRGLDRSPVWRGMVNETMRKRLADVPLALYRERYPALKTLDRYYGPPGGPALAGDAFQGVPPEGNVIVRNVCVGKWLDLGWHAQAAWFDVRDNYVGSDPGLVAPASCDFRLRPESEVFKLGFMPIPTERIGLRHDLFRQEAARLANRSGL